MSDDGTGMVSFRVEDPALAAAIEEAAESEGSKSEAVRNGLRAGLLGDDVESEDASDALPSKARDAHRKLVEWAGVGGRLELDTAESVLANHLNIQKAAVRKTVLQPLKAGDAIALHQGLHEVTLVVGRLDGSDVEARETPASTTSTEAATDGGEARDRLDDLANAEVER